MDEYAPRRLSLSKLKLSVFDDPGRPMMPTGTLLSMLAIMHRMFSFKARFKAIPDGIKKFSWVTKAFTKVEATCSSFENLPALFALTWGKSHCECIQKWNASMT